MLCRDSKGQLAIVEFLSSQQQNKSQKQKQTMGELSRVNEREAFLNFDEEDLESDCMPAVLFRSLVATMKLQPALDDSLKHKAVKILIHVSRQSMYSADIFLSRHGRTTDESLTNFVQSMAVLISSANQIITTTAMKMLNRLMFYCPTQFRYTLVKADLIPQLITSLNPLSLSFAKAVDIHLHLMESITYSLGLPTPMGLKQLAIEGIDEQQAVHETHPSTPASLNHPCPPTLPLPLPHHPHPCTSVSLTTHALPLPLPLPHHPHPPLPLPLPHHPCPPTLCLSLTTHALLLPLSALPPSPSPTPPSASPSPPTPSHSLCLSLTTHTSHPLPLPHHPHPPTPLCLSSPPTPSHSLCLSLTTHTLPLPSASPSPPTPSHSPLPLPHHPHPPTPLCLSLTTHALPLPLPLPHHPCPPTPSASPSPPMPSHSLCLSLTTHALPCLSLTTHTLPLPSASPSPPMPSHSPLPLPHHPCPPTPLCLSLTTHTLPLPSASPSPPMPSHSPLPLPHHPHPPTPLCLSLTTLNSTPNRSDMSSAHCPFSPKCPPFLNWSDDEDLETELEDSDASKFSGSDASKVSKCVLSAFPIVLL
ncbi:hypothetical protein BLNAU_12022 [Blattamonas nauphoetae]|uniref:Uncharacterized protein n=1 Tax=Blattamonas nauphoetae TaxID=2049346 RepID=A0ABQ9XKS3_9EUKA|nr:hypothetical protein BLNAU_12022 [Blattamonas nauphoetae]